jgi:hypothetical protein
VLQRVKKFVFGETVSPEQLEQPGQDRLAIDIKARAYNVHL